MKRDYMFITMAISFVVSLTVVVVMQHFDSTPQKVSKHTVKSDAVVYKNAKSWSFDSFVLNNLSGNKTTNGSKKELPKSKIDINYKTKNLISSL